MTGEECESNSYIFAESQIVMKMSIVGTSVCLVLDRDGGEQRVARNRKM